MFISSISIRNFRNFEDLAITGLRNGTVVIGENGSGKSNLLHALRLALDASLPDSRRVLRAEDFWSGLNEPFAGTVIEVQVELQDWNTDPHTKALLADCVVADHPLTARITYRYRPQQRLEDGAVPTGPEHYEWRIFGADSEAAQLSGSFRRWLSLRVLPALRDAESDLESWRRSPLADLLDRLQIPTAVLRDVAAKVDEAGAVLLDDRNVADLDVEIRDQIEQMVGELFAVDTRLGINATRPEQVLRAIRVMIADPSTPTVGDISLGTANVLFLALLLRSVLAQRLDRINSLLAVEEPEAHLHPHIQRVLFRYLLGLEVPIMVTTHSAHIASVSDPRALVLLRNHNGRTESYTIADAGLTNQQIDDLDRYLDVTRSEMLFAKAVILVEGAAELYLVPAFAAERTIELDELGITVASVQGTDFAPYRKMLRAFGIPCIVITDGDADLNSEGDTGLRRAAALINPKSRSRTEIDAALDDGDLKLARQLLSRRQIFVGTHTLEADLADTAADAMQTAYEELGGAAPGRFSDDLAGNTAELRGRLVRRVERIGKGRYAQRLAAHLEGIAPPAYLGEAIDAAKQAVNG